MTFAMIYGACMIFLGVCVGVVLWVIRERGRQAAKEAWDEDLVGHAEEPWTGETGGA